MRNLFQLIVRYRIALLFLALEAVSFWLLVNFNNHQQIRFLSSTAEVTGALNEQKSEATAYFHLKQANKDLSVENARLRNLLRQNYQGDAWAFEHWVDTSYQQLYEYKPAQVVSSTVNRRNNYLIINKGANQGVKPDMGVIGPQGVVGVVKEASANYATVLPVIHSKAKVSTQLKGTDYFGLTTWPGYDPKRALLSDIPSHVALQAGDTLIARGGSGIFPAGIPVGYVKSWEEMPAMNFYEIELKLATNFFNVGHVYVVKNIRKQEFIQLMEAEEVNAQ